LPHTATTYTPLYDSLHRVVGLDDVPCMLDDLNPHRAARIIMTYVQIKHIHRNILNTVTEN